LTFASLLLIPSKEKLIDYHIPALVAECQSERRMAEVGVMRLDDWPSPRLHLYCCSAIGFPYCASGSAPELRCEKEGMDLSDADT